jgi:hypothetical protein
MAMVDEAMRDPISVGMLKIDGAGIMALGEKPGPRIGWTLHALLEEVLEDPTKNTEEYMAKRAGELLMLPDADLRDLGAAGKDKKDEAEEAEIKKLQEKHHVS